MARSTGTTQQGRQRDKVIIAVLAVVALGLIGWLVFRPDGGGEPATAVVGTEQSPTGGTTAAPTVDGYGPLGDLARREEGDPAALGAVDAPVTMIAFTDYRCAFCAKFSRETEPQLVQEYVDNGTLRIEWRDFPIFGEESTVAAQAGRAAAMQGMFWEYNAAIFADSPERAHAELPEDTLVAYAEQIGVPDIERFRADMTGPDAAAAVDRDVEEASALGVPSTPAFVINGTPVMGAQPIDAFRTQIDQALAAAS